MTDNDDIATAIAKAINEALNPPQQTRQQLKDEITRLKRHINRLVIRNRELEYYISYEAEVPQMMPMAEWRERI